MSLCSSMPSSMALSPADYHGNSTMRRYEFDTLSTLCTGLGASFPGAFGALVFVHSHPGLALIAAVYEGQSTMRRYEFDTLSPLCTGLRAFFAGSLGAVLFVHSHPALAIIRF